MDGKAAAEKLWEQCRDSLRGWSSAIRYFGKQAIEDAYRQGFEDGKRETSSVEKE